MAYVTVCSITLVVITCFGCNTCVETNTDGNCDQRRVQGLDTFKDLDLESGNLEDSFNNVYREVQCSYAYGALTHMRLTKVLLVDKHLSGSIRFSFTQPAALMLDTVSKVPALCSIRDQMWLFLLYTQMVTKQLESVPLENGNVRNEDQQQQAAVLSVHEAVDTLLDEFMVARCVDFNRKNVPPWAAVEYPAESLWPWYEKNYQTIIGQVKDNRCELLSPCEFAEVAEKYSPSRLSLNYIFDDDQYYITAIRLFGNTHETEDRREIINHLIELYRVGTDQLPNVALAVRIKSLGTFHNDFVQLLKIMAFRNVWDYMKTVSAVGVLHCSATLYLFYNISVLDKDMSDLLKEFAECLDLTDDPDVKTVLARLNRRCVLFLKRGNTGDERAMTSAMNNAISKLSIGRLMNRMVLPEKGQRNIEKHVQDVQHLMDYGYKKRMITWNVKKTKTFVDHLKKTFYNKIDFGVIHSFMRLQHSSVFHRFSDLELSTRG